MEHKWMAPREFVDWWFERGYQPYPPIVAPGDSVTLIGSACIHITGDASAQDRARRALAEVGE